MKRLAIGLMVALGFLILLSMQTEAIGTTGLWAYFPLDANCTDVVNANALTPYGDPTFATGGIINTGILLDGNDYCEMGVGADSPNPLTGGPTEASGAYTFAISWWMNATAFYDEAVTAPVCYGDETSYQYVQAYFVGEFSNVYDIRAQMNSGWAMIANIDTFVGTLDFYAVTYDGTAFHAYKNGVHLGESFEVQNGLRNEELVIGSHCHGEATNPFQGLIDEVGYWDINLTQSNVTDLYNDGDGCAYGSFAACGAAPPPAGGSPPPTCDDNSSLCTNLTAFYTFDDDDFSGTLLYDSQWIWNGTTVGTPTTGASGRVGEAFTFDALDDGVTVNFTTIEDIGDNGLSICTWAKFENDNANDDEMTLFDMLGSGAMTFERDDSPQNIEWYAASPACRIRANDIEYMDSDWHHFCVIRHSDDCDDVEIWIDGLNKSLTIETNGDASGMDFENVGIGCSTGQPGYACSADYLNGTLDEMGIWYKGLNREEIELLYNEDTFPFGTLSLPPSITINTELTSNQNLTSRHLFIDINVTAVNITNPNSWTAKIYLNGTLNTTVDTTLNLIYDTWRINVTDLGRQEVGWVVNVTVNNSNGGTPVYDNIQRTNIFVDSIMPASVQANMANNTILYYGIDTIITAILNGTDTNLYAINFTMAMTNGTVLNNTFVENINTSLYNVNFTFNTDALINRSYMLLGTLWDSHTDKEVKNLTWYFSEDNLIAEDDIVWEGDFKNETGLGEPATYFYLAPEEDRYKLKMTFDEQGLSHTINISSPSGNLRYRADDGYKGHFVYFPTTRWIDHEGTNIKNVVVTQLEANKWELYVEHYWETDEIEFESMGDLNTLEEIWYFNVSHGFTFTAKDKIANTSISTFTVEVFDGVSLLQNKSTASGNLTFNITGWQLYNVNITTPADYVTNTSKINFSHAGTFEWVLTAANSLYLFFYDEQLDLLLDWKNVTVQVINFANESNEYTTATGSTFQSGFTVGSYELRYWAEGYAKRSYYTIITDSTTQSLDLYLLNSSDGGNTYKLFEITDESASRLSNATLKMQRYFINDNAYVTVEMARTNDAGQSFVFAELYDATYRFVIEYQGETKKITSDTKLDTRDLFFKIDLIDTGLDTIYDVINIDYTLAWKNSTNRFEFTYNSVDSTIDEGRLFVEAIDMFNENTVCNTTLSADSGTIVCDVVAYNNTDTNLIAYAFVQTEVDAVEHFVDTDSYNYRQPHEIFGLAGMFLGTLVVLVLAFVGIKNPSTAIMFSLFGLVIAAASGLIWMQVSTIISAIVVGIIFMASLKT